MRKNDLAGMMAVMAMMSQGYSPPQMTEESKQNLARSRKKQGLENQPLNKGLKQFTINGVTVWALNLKNAKRKIERVGLT